MTQLAAAVPQTHHQNSQRKTVKEMMNQSTIYKRHQTRVLKSMAKKDDPRPKMVRVLGGLPGFRTIIPEYVSPEDLSTTTSATSGSLLATSSTSSSSSFDADQTVVQFQQNNNRDDISSPYRRQVTPAHYSVLAAGALGALAEACYGSTATKKSIGNVSPFRNSPLASSSSLATDRATVPLVQEHTNVSFFRLHAAFANSSSNASVNAASTARAATKSQLVVGASTASLLFGTKVMADEFLASNSSNEEEDVLFSSSSPLSSAMAGAAVATISLIEPAEAKLLRNPASLTPSGVGMANRLMQQNLLPRHILGATIYFSSYEMMKSFLAASSNDNNHNNKSSNNNTITVALSGALAGALYQGTLLYNTTCTSSSLLIPSQQAAAARMVPSMLRVAPAHALLFIGYEWVQQAKKNN